MQGPDSASLFWISNEELQRAARVVGGLSSIRATLEVVREDVEILLAQGVLAPSECQAILRLQSVVLNGLDEIQELPSSSQDFLRLAAARLRRT